MALAHVGLAIGVGLGLVGTVTATDAISLREVAHAVDIPFVSAAVIGARQSMTTDLAHNLEAVAAVLGCGALLLPLRRPLMTALAPARRYATLAISPITLLLR
jgi:hypothetical protein